MRFGAHFVCRLLCFVCDALHHNKNSLYLQKIGNIILTLSFCG
ncbi:hypothetical protein HMPREF0476_0461 [Kingella kingae ATCC 23330]|uniref:Uncharacterized protein n=1 Tax=Kingella kingae ATCC 23330 TaxID=887327 RepID=F5S5H8_KINKI|nr:hypothetical protein HMPREF0476_0461 [Kingella kingae ATCC 23330]